ncbi:MAG: aminopeptidase P family protein [Lachnospiraceae bacterium]|nr:aminopeptidase P family protein [Lachnospiraceae bacterium]
MERITWLRNEMKKARIDCYFLPTGDHHGSEYVCAAFKGREFLSGFTGSAGILIVTEKEAGLWTDGRYFTQAEKELLGKAIKLYRMGEPKVPTIFEYLTKTLKDGETLAFDGRLLSIQTGRKIAKIQEDKNIKINFEADLLAGIWRERPSLPMNPIWELGIDWCGQSTADKLKKVRDKINKENADALIINSLDDIMWLFNIRGSDIPDNPVALSYAYVAEDKTYLFVQTEALSEELGVKFANLDIEIVDYHSFYTRLNDLAITPKQKIILDQEKCNFHIYKIIEQKANPILSKSPTVILKAIKNEAELRHLNNVYKKDSAAVIRFIKWLKENDQQVTEMEAASKIDQLRRETEGFIDLSFGTIAAYGANAAMMHYQATEDSNTVIEKEGLFLIDSGGQYFGGTTDVTRTIVMGDVSNDVKRYFTAVVRGMLNLSNLTFLYGCTGRNLDIAARMPLWELRSDYKCGTGHGIGYMLSVHEGPQNIRMPYREDCQEAVIEPGMIISNEPGVYKAGEYGIRIENIMAVKKVAENEDGKFLAFEPLTFVPIDLAALDVTRMSAEDRLRLNEYHQSVYENMCDYLSEDELIWLKEATKFV